MNKKETEKLVKSIREDIFNNDKKISDILLKTKQLNIRSKDFLTFLDNEIIGYKNGLELPDYRKLGCSVIATFNIGHSQYKNYPILNQLPDFMRDSFNIMYLTLPICSIEEISKGINGDLIENDIQSSIDLVEEYVKKDGFNKNFQILKFRQQISIIDTYKIISNVRNTLMEYINLEFETKKDAIVKVTNVDTESFKKKASEYITEFIKISFISFNINSNNTNNSINMNGNNINNTNSKIKSKTEISNEKPSPIMESIISFFTKLFGIN